MSTDNKSRITMISWALHASGVVGVLLAVVAFYSLVYSNMREQRAADANRSGQLELLLASSAEVQREQYPLREEFDQLLETTTRVRSRLPNDLDAKSFVSQVHDAAQETGLQIIDHRVGATQTGQSLSSTEVSFQCNGSFASMCEFLNKVRQFTRATEISKLDLESTINSDSYPIQVTFVLYYGAKSNDREVGGIL